MLRLVESRVPGAIRCNKCGCMRFIILYLLLMSSITPTLGDGIINGISLQEMDGTEAISPLKDNVSDLIASNGVPFNVMPPSFEKPRAEQIFVIGDVALSQVAKNLNNLSQERPGIVGNGKLTALYSTFSSAFGTARLPIDIIQYGSNNSQLPEDLSSGLGKSLNERSVEYFQIDFPVFPTIDTSSGSSESKGGVTVIWNP